MNVDKIHCNYYVYSPLGSMTTSIPGMANVNILQADPHNSLQRKRAVYETCIHHYLKGQGRRV